MRCVRCGKASGRQAVCPRCRVSAAQTRFGPDGEVVPGEARIEGDRGEQLSLLGPPSQTGEGLALAGPPFEEGKG